MSAEPLPATKQEPRKPTTAAPAKLEPLPPIPTPPEHQWRHFRVSVLPFLAFAMVTGISVWLWGHNLANPLITGEVEGLQSDLVSPVAGRVVQVTASLHQEVKAGDILAYVDFTEPEVRSNTLAMIRAEMQAIKAEGGFNSGDRVRYSQFKFDWQTRRIQQALDTLAVPAKQAQFERDSQLFQGKFISMSQFESDKLALDQLKMTVDLTPAALSAAQKALEELDPVGAGQQSLSVQAAMKVAEEKLRLAESSMQPIPIRAPISGRVATLNTLAGSTIAAGGIIMNIASTKPERIVGYISQPLRIVPKVGMKVNVRSRGLHREAVQAEVTSIGPRIELFTVPVQFAGAAKTEERGLPVIMNVPPQMTLRPGELVDLTFVIN